MKKYILSVFLSIIFIFAIIPINLANASFMDIEYLDIRISNNIDISNYFSLFSETGFLLYKKTDKENPVHLIDNPEILVSFNSVGSIDILDMRKRLIKTIPSDGSMILKSALSEESILKVDKNRYRDFISFLKINQQLSLINHVQIEHYLYGVLPREVSPSFPPEALKAQAVASRNFAMVNVKKHLKDGFNLCDTVDCQVYSGYDWEDSRINKAVDETKDIFVLYNGALANTTFHSTSGGHTENSAKVWGGSVPYLIAVDDPYSSNTPNSSWNISLSSLELKARLADININIGEILDLEIMEVSDANRVLKIKIIGTENETIIEGRTLRSALGTTIMKSTWFNVVKEGANSENLIYVIDGNSLLPISININDATIINGNNIKTLAKNLITKILGKDKSIYIDNSFASDKLVFTFEGKGYGHGVGMSQYGAVEMAKLGFTFEEILKHYYINVDITNIKN